MNDVILLGLATFSITYLLKYTAGPFDVFGMLRDLAGVHLVEGHVGEAIVEQEIIDDSFTAKLVSCWWCLSTWVALLLALVTWSNWLAWPAAIAVAGLCYKFVEG